MDWKLELVAVPVSDVDRAIAFYVDKAGFVLDLDHRVNDEPPLRAAHAARLRLLDRPWATAPPTRLRARPGACSSLSPTQDAKAGGLAARGVDVGEVQDFPWGRFVFFSDPDGNRGASREFAAGVAGSRHSRPKPASPGPRRTGVAL